MPGRYLTETPPDQRKAPFELRAVFDRGVVKWIADQTARAHPSFPRRRFIESVVADLPPLGLKDRSARIARGLLENLPADFPQALQILLSAICADDGIAGGIEGMGGFRYLPFLNFVGMYGLDDPGRSIPSLGVMTKYFSAEFDIRPFLLRHPDRTLAAIKRWSTDPDWRLRRLASEGTRPRLPWGLRIPGFIKDPSINLALLENMKDDPHNVVRRSIANHLNDISRDHPVTITDTLRRWSKSASPARKQLVRHALRTLVKQGNPRALALLGFGNADGLALTRLRLQKQSVTLGEALLFSFAIQSSQRKLVRVCIDYRIHHLRASGKHSPKTFKLAERKLKNGNPIQIEKRHPIVPITTRRYYPGLHKLEIIINGKSMATATFTLKT